MKTADIQKQRVKEIENAADKLIKSVDVATLTSINESGYPRICVLTKAADNGFREVFFTTSKRSHLNGKATHFENNSKASVCYFKDGDSVTLIGNVSFVEDIALQEKLWLESDRKFFSKGVSDPKFRLLKFQTIEATFWIDNKFRTVKYKG